MSVSMTLAALFYGDHPQLAERFLNSLQRTPLWNEVTDFRFGLNAVSAQTEGFIRTRFQKCSRNVSLLTCPTNPGKYPVLRMLQHGCPYETNTTHLLWCDDDIWFSGIAQAPDWCSDLTSSLSQCDMLGRLYRIHTRGNQEQWARQQPWHTGKPLPDARYLFATGSWWGVRRSLLQQWSWPPPELIHNGGDVMLGELCRQQNLHLKSWHRGVIVNDHARSGLSLTPLGVSPSEPVAAFPYTWELL